MEYRGSFASPPLGIPLCFGPDISRELLPDRESQGQHEEYDYKKNGMDEDYVQMHLYYGVTNAGDGNTRYRVDQFGGPTSSAST